MDRYDGSDEARRSGSRAAERRRRRRIGLGPSRSTSPTESRRRSPLAALRALRPNTLRGPRTPPIKVSPPRTRVGIRRRSSRWPRSTISSSPIRNSRVTTPTRTPNRRQSVPYAYAQQQAAVRPAGLRAAAGLRPQRVRAARLRHAYDQQAYAQQGYAAAGLRAAAERTSSSTPTRSSSSTAAADYDRKPTRSSSTPSSTAQQPYDQQAYAQQQPTRPAGVRAAVRTAGVRPGATRSSSSSTRSSTGSNARPAGVRAAGRTTRRPTPPSRRMRSSNTSSSTRRSSTPSPATTTRRPTSRRYGQPTLRRPDPALRVPGSRHGRPSRATGRRQPTGWGRSWMAVDRGLPADHLGPLPGRLRGPRPVARQPRPVPRRRGPLGSRSGSRSRTLFREPVAGAIVVVLGIILALGGLLVWAHRGLGRAVGIVFGLLGHDRGHRPDRVDRRLSRSATLRIQGTLGTDDEALRVRGVHAADVALRACSRCSSGGATSAASAWPRAH